MKETLSPSPAGEELRNWLRMATWDEWWAVVDQIINWAEKQEEVKCLVQNSSESNGSLKTPED